SADLRLTTRSEGEVEIEGHFEVRDAVIDSPRVSASPVRGVSFAVDGAGVFAPAERTLTWQRGGIRVGEVTVRLGATLTLSDDGFRGSVEATLPPTSCASVLAAFPPDVVGPVADFDLRGTMSGIAKLHLDLANLKATELEMKVADGCEFLASPDMAHVGRFEQAFVHQALEPDGSVFSM